MIPVASLGQFDLKVEVKHTLKFDPRVSLNVKTKRR